MKPELLHLLSKLKTEHPDATTIIIPITGSPVFVNLQHGYRRFENLDALESYAWPQEEQVGTVAPRGPNALPIITEPIPRTSGYIVTNP